MSQQVFIGAQKPSKSTTSKSNGALQRNGDKCRKKKPLLQHSVVGPVSENVPPVVHEILRSPGQPFDPGARSFMEPRFGHDFSRVRVYADETSKKPNFNKPHQDNSSCAAAIPSGLANWLTTDRGQKLPEDLRSTAERKFEHSFAGVRLHQGTYAHRLASDVKARAFTLGEDIVFRAGQYAPDTPAGRDLLWHEMGHVAFPSTKSEIMRALLYDTKRRTIPMLPVGHTAKSMRDLVDKKIAKKEIASATVKGVKPGSEEEIFLLHIIWQLGNRDRRDTFIRLETAIGWEKKVGTGSGIIPTGLVTVTIDDKGNVTAELMQASPMALPAKLPMADAIKKLQTDFGISSVSAGDKAWKEEELADVIGALARLPASDQAALKGVDLSRFASLPKGHSGEFTCGGGVAKGATTVTSQPALKLADSAFISSENIVGDVAHQAPASFETILHEAGHAVEKQVKCAAARELDAAVIKRNLAAPALNTTLAKLKKAGGKEAENLRATAVTQRKVFDVALAREKKKEKGLKVTEVSESTIKSLATVANAKKTACESALKTADAAVKGFSQQDIDDSLAYRTAEKAAELALDDYMKKTASDTVSDLNSLDDAMQAVIGKRNEAREALKVGASQNPALATFSPVELAQSEWMDAILTLAHTRGRSLRLDKFVAVVNAANITPFTDYARKNWPYKPEEFYAEAYSLWLNESKFVEDNYKPIFDFFESGSYLK